MIPLPPPDSRLPGMRVAMDGDAMASVFENAFGNMVVVRCDPHYARYKPPKYCRVQYRLELVEADGRSIRTQACFVMYPRARAEKLAARHGMVDHGSPRWRYQATYVGQLHGIAQLFPLDLGLSRLPKAVSPRFMTRVFRRELAGRLGGHLSVCSVDLVRYKANKRAVLKYGLDGTVVPAVYGKLRKDGAGNLFRVSTALRRGGVATPDSLAWLVDLGMVIQAEGAGIRLGDLRATDSYPEKLPAVAETLARLHSLRVDGLPRFVPKDEANELQNAARTIGSLLPGLAALTSSLAGRLAELLFEPGGKWTTTHGSFHDDQVLVRDDGVTLLDMDGSKLANPMSDVGHFLSYLPAEGSDGAYERFLDHYLSARPSKVGEHLLFEAVSTLRWSTLPFRELRPDWPEAVEQRVLRAADRLDEYSSSASSSS